VLATYAMHYIPHIAVTLEMAEPVAGKESVKAHVQCSSELSAAMQGIREEELETVVSKTVQTPLIVLRGRHAGRHGRLLEKHRGKVLLELTESRDVAEVALDDVADFTGLLEGEDF
jgi:hypothetical protein